MENSYPEVFEISSDEEEEEEEVTRREENEDSDEIMVVREVSGSSICQRMSKKSDFDEEEDDDDDDDDECLILDGDPDKIVEVENEDGNESDELQVVGEKGQIACRDYPHPRHLCARYPFSSNPHEKYCDLCHCYVCDTRAPCKHWGTGVSSHHHCHSNDKEETWKLQRKWIKEGITAPQLPTPKIPIPAPLIPVPPLVHKPVHAHSVNNGGPSFMKYTISKSATLRPCSSTANYDVPNIIKNHHHQQPGSTRLPHHGVTTTTLQKPSGRIVTAHPPSFKKVRTARYGAGSFNSNLVSNRLVSQQLRMYPHPKDTTSYAAQNTYQSSNQTPLDGSYMGPQSQYAVQPQVYSPPLPQPVQTTQQVYSQPLPQPVYSQPLPQPVQGAQQAYSQPTPQPVQAAQHAYSQPIPEPAEAPNSIYHLVDPAHSGLNPSLGDYDLNWFNDTSQSHCQIPKNPEFSNAQPTATSQPPLVVQLSSVQSTTSGLNPPASQFTTVEPTLEPLPATESTTLDSALYDLDWIHSLANLESGNETLSSDFGYIPSHAEMEASLLTFDFENP